jgi:predicted nucleic acid-binding protein
VSTSKEIVIQDACILFDLIDLGLIDAFFELDLTVLTTPQVMGEIEEEEQLRKVEEFTSVKKLIIDEEGLLDHVDKIFGENNGLSYTDCSVLELALRKQGIVLSSDWKLRTATVRNNLTVRGVLWIIDELCERKLITIEQALQKLSLYPQVNQRAPKDEIEKLISKLMSIKEQTGMYKSLFQDRG